MHIIGDKKARDAVAEEGRRGKAFSSQSELLKSSFQRGISNGALCQSPHGDLMQQLMMISSDTWNIFTYNC
jgi:hypothetical protein